MHFWAAKLQPPQFKELPYAYAGIITLRRGFENSELLIKKKSDEAWREHWQMESTFHFPSQM